MTERERERERERCRKFSQIQAGRCLKHTKRLVFTDRKSARAVKSTLHLHRVMTRPRENIQLRTRVHPTPIAIVCPIARPRNAARIYRAIISSLARALRYVALHRVILQRTSVLTRVRARARRRAAINFQRPVSLSDKRHLIHACESPCGQHRVCCMINATAR